MFFIFSLFVVYLYFVVVHFCENKTMLQPPDHFFFLFFNFFCKSFPPQLLCAAGQIKAEELFEAPETFTSLQKTTKSLGMSKPLPAWNRSCKPCLFSHYLGIQLTEESHLLAATFILAVIKTGTKAKLPFIRETPRPL